MNKQDSTALVCAKLTTVSDKPPAQSRMSRVILPKRDPSPAASRFLNPYISALGRCQQSWRIVLYTCIEGAEKKKCHKSHRESMPISFDVKRARFKSEPTLFLDGLALYIHRHATGRHRIRTVASQYSSVCQQRAKSPKKKKLPFNPALGTWRQ